MSDRETLLKDMFQKYFCNSHKKDVRNLLKEKVEIDINILSDQFFEKFCGPAEPSGCITASHTNN